MNQKFNFVFCKYAHGKNEDITKCYNCERKRCPSVSNILHGVIFKLPVIKQIYNVFYNISWHIQSRKYEKDYISENETQSLKHVWGIKSYDDLSGHCCNLFTMNDFDLTYHKETEDYSISIETIYVFKKEDGEKIYMQSILDSFTKWMDEQEYKTDYKFDLYKVFTYGNNINTHFKTIEECYANFKMLVNGYCGM